MTSTLSAEIAATCNALGYFDQKAKKYYADSNTLETVKDLIRYLRRDDESHEIRRQLGEAQVLQTDLLPLLKSYWEQTDLFDVLLRLLVNLTSPALILWQEAIPTDKTARNHFMKIEDHLQKYKQAFADETVWAVLSARLSKILEMDYTERGEENSLVIERILILIRNILYVPANPEFERRPDNDASVHDQVLWSLHQSGMLDIILFITSSVNEQTYYMHALEILSFMLREQNATELAQAALQRNHTEKMRDEAELLAIRHRETNQKQQKIKMYNGARHSRFGGTFVVKSMKSISDNELIYHKPLNSIDAINFDVAKRKPKTPKNRLPIKTTTSERRSAFSIRLFLKEFCIEFLNGAYNTLMYHVKDNLVRAKAQAHDESYYLWALRFFMEFNRCYKLEVKLVSETMSIQAFHYVQQQMENYFDMISMNKADKCSTWSRRLHLALLAYRELLFTICAMDKSPDGSVKDSARIIKSNIFYVVEYRELILTLLVTYDELKMSTSYLNDLIETQHIFVRLFQSYCERYGEVVVQKKAKAKRKKKTKSSGTAAITDTDVPRESNLESLWDDVAPQLSAVLEGASNIPTDVVPFDVVSDIPIDEQKADAMKNIQRHLKEDEFENAVGLLRASREVWPENDIFGSPDIPIERELLALRDIFLADLGVNVVRNRSEPQNRDHIEDENDDDDDINEEMEGFANVSEATVKFSDFTKRLAHPKIVRACGLTLRYFERNSVHTNHCIAKLLHRIAYDSKMYAMIFQASIFRTFQKIYSYKDLPQYKELAKFATYITRQFFTVAQKNRKIFIEVLFWKSATEAFDVEEGYGSYHKTQTAANRAWSELEEDELRRLFMEHRENQITEDVVDWVVNNLIDNTRSRRGVLKKLKEMCLLTDYKRPRKSGISGKTPRQWGEDEEEQLRELYEQFKDAMDPLGCIMDRLDVRRPKNRIVEKLLVMGLIQDKKEVRKKRARKSRRSPTGRGNASDSEPDLLNSSSDDSDQDTIRRTSNAPATTGHSKRRAKASSSKRKTVTHHPVSSAELILLLKKVLHLSDALDWLRESLSDVADDLEQNDDDDDSGVPLVAILDFATSAMEDEDFKKLLKGFGIKEPADEQEIYWRIPSALSLPTLRSYCNLLTNALENKLPEESSSAVLEQPMQDESSDEDVFDRIKQITKQKNDNLEQNLESGRVNNEELSMKRTVTSSGSNSCGSRSRSPSISRSRSASRSRSRSASKSRSGSASTSRSRPASRSLSRSASRSRSRSASRSRSRSASRSRSRSASRSGSRSRSKSASRSRSRFSSSSRNTDSDNDSRNAKNHAKHPKKSKRRQNPKASDNDDKKLSQVSNKTSTNKTEKDQKILKEKGKGQIRKRITNVESDDDNNFDDLKEEDKFILNVKRNTRLLDSDSDDDLSEKENKNISGENSKRQRSSDSESLTPKLKRSKVIVSDEDE